MTRWDLLRQTCYLSSFVTRWTSGCDKLLYRLMCWISSSLDFCLTLRVGDCIKDWKVEVWSDADYASDLHTKRSTSGVFAAFSAGSTFAPVTGQSNKQAATADSTPNAEVVALAKATTKTAIPLMDLVKHITSRSPALTVHEDNDAARTAALRGYSHEMRHLKRQFGVSLAQLAEFFSSADQLDSSKGGLGSLVRCDSAQMRADGFTKSFKSVQEWTRILDLLCIVKRRPV